MAGYMFIDIMLMYKADKYGAARAMLLLQHPTVDC